MVSSAGFLFSRKSSLEIPCRLQTIAMLESKINNGDVQSGNDV